MSILNYFFIGTVFTFIVDLLLGMEGIKNHPKMKDKNWGMRERIICIIVWPLSVLIFALTFIKQFFRK
tara:strand:+ start:276 stop:479 length:204 start_codon:yes stop_codon:yes gene_type:complete